MPFSFILKPPFRLAIIFCVAITSVQPVMAQPAMDEGKKLFTKTALPNCAICHTLKHAEAAGEVGPSLDELKPDAARVEKAVRNGIGQMPAIMGLSDAQIKDLAKYVAIASGAQPATTK